MPHYQIKLVAICNVVVEADSEEDAFEIAIENASSGDYEFIEGENEGLIDHDKLDFYLRHADLKI